MSYLLKDIYSPDFYNGLAAVLKQVLPGFDNELFLQGIYADDFEQKELKARMRHTAKVMHRFMGTNFPDNARRLLDIVQQLQQRTAPDLLAYMFLPDYIEVYGQDDYEASVAAIEMVTQFVSCEYAVRPLLLRYEKKMLQQMLDWSRHPNHKVRRLASEGSRPRLPWALAIPALKKDPAPILPLLEQLKADPHEWVRKSVANSLNDIAKDHPDIVLDIAGRWKGHSAHTDALIKHGCRTLFKQGHPGILELYQLDSRSVSLSGARIHTLQLPVGTYLEFSFNLENKADRELLIRLEYAVYFLRNNGSHARKVFKISERNYAPGEQALILRRQSFKPITTRTYYPGQHQLALIVNGKEYEKMDFLLIG